jgi:hypothetical protein
MSICHQVIGSRLTHLSLVHIEEVDIRAIAIITNCCPNLVSFGLHNCEFVQPRDVSDDDERDADGPFRDVDRSARSLCYVNVLHEAFVYWKLYRVCQRF